MKHLDAGGALVLSAVPVDPPHVRGNVLLRLEVLAADQTAVGLKSFVDANEMLRQVFLRSESFSPNLTQEWFRFSVEGSNVR